MCGSLDERVGIILNATYGRAGNKNKTILILTYIYFVISQCNCVLQYVFPMHFSVGYPHCPSGSILIPPHP